MMLAISFSLFLSVIFGFMSKSFHRPQSSCVLRKIPEHRAHSLTQGLQPLFSEVGIRANLARVICFRTPEAAETVHRFFEDSSDYVESGYLCRFDNGLL